MNHSLDRETSRLNPALVWLAVVGIALVGLMAMSNTLLVDLTSSAPASVAQASGMESIGVSGTTTAALAGLMNTLGVSPW